MPPHLHPRSAATSTLFASTLIASFVIVSIPHLFPCPAPRKGRYDSSQQSNPSGKLKPEVEGGQEQSLHDRSKMQYEAKLFRELEGEANRLDKEARECPVPKPRGLLGRVLGFEGVKGKDSESPTS